MDRERFVRVRVGGVPGYVRAMGAGATPSGRRLRETREAEVIVHRLACLSFVKAVVVVCIDYVEHVVAS